MTYSEFVASLVKPGDKIQLAPHQKHLLHMLIGLSGEVGELTDTLKRHCIYNQPLDQDNMIEELGDIEFYLQGIRNEIGLTRDEIIVSNQRKLSARYASGKYSDKQAEERADKKE